jgi:biopolymer transport protein ExbD
MIRTPSSRRKKKTEEKLNLIPIMDSVFIFIFFLLMSSQFIKIMEIGSDVPIVSEAEPPKNKNPLALVLKVMPEEIILTKGLNASLVGKYPRLETGDYDLEKLHSNLLELKKTDLNEESIVIEPHQQIGYEDLIKVMDAVRIIEKTDEALFKKGKDGLDERIKNLFHKIIFGNINS